jgi:hypothetical protein
MDMNAPPGRHFSGTDFLKIFFLPLTTGQQNFSDAIPKL